MSFLFFLKLRKLHSLLLFVLLFSADFHGVVGSVGHTDVCHTSTCQAVLRVDVIHAIVYLLLLFKVNVFVPGPKHDLASLRRPEPLLLALAQIIISSLIENYVAVGTMIVVGDAIIVENIIVIRLKLERVLQVPAMRASPRLLLCLPRLRILFYCSFSALPLPTLIPDDLVHHF